MSRVLIKNLPEMVNQRVTIKGFVNNIRNMKKIGFLVIRDQTGIAQVVLEGAAVEAIGGLTLESVVEITGTVVDNPRVKIGGVEIHYEDLKIINTAAAPLPVDKESGLNIRQDWRFLDLRRPENLLIFKVQTTAEHAMREFWVENEFIEIHSPKLMGTPSESGSELFKVEYFERQAYLAQSPQFYKQMAMAAGFDRVFEIGPVFRANPSFTSRHDTEFTSVDVEMSWIDSHEDIMSLEERWIQFFIKAIKEAHGDMIRETFGKEIIIPEVPFPRVTMERAQEILAELGYTVTTDDGDLDPQGEQLLSSYIKEQTGHDLVFVTDYPVGVRPFYHMRHEDNPNLTKSYDLLWNGLEVTTGAQREHRYEVLSKQVLEKGLSLESLRYYLDFFKYGCPPHGGYGFGLTRMLMIILGFKNVREVTYLYRGPKRLVP